MNPHLGLAALARLRRLRDRGAHALPRIDSARALLLKLTHAQKSDVFLASSATESIQCCLRALRHNSMKQRRPRMMRRLAAALVVLGGTALRQPPRRIAAEKTLRVLIADV